MQAEVQEWHYDEWSEPAVQWWQRRRPLEGTRGTHVLQLYQRIRRVFQLLACEYIQYSTVAPSFPDLTYHRLYDE